MAQMKFLVDTYEGSVSEGKGNSYEVEDLAEAAALILAYAGSSGADSGKVFVRASAIEMGKV